MQQAGRQRKNFIDEYFFPAWFNDITDFFPGFMHTLIRIHSDLDTVNLESFKYKGCRVDLGINTTQSSYNTNPAVRICHKKAFGKVTGLATASTIPACG
jgi:hypothetical protein